jgi:hypothetical protein
MPSEDSTREALAAIAAARDDYRSALVGTADQLRGMLLAHAGSEDQGVERTARELGNFAAGHIDVERFASLFKPDQTLDEASRAHLERAAETLESLAAGGVLPSTISTIFCEPSSRAASPPTRISAPRR